MESIATYSLPVSFTTSGGDAFRVPAEKLQPFRVIAKPGDDARDALDDRVAPASES